MITSNEPEQTCPKVRFTLADLGRVCLVLIDNAQPIQLHLCVFDDALAPSTGRVPTGWGTSTLLGRQRDRRQDRICRRPQLQHPGVATGRARCVDRLG